MLRLQLPNVNQAPVVVGKWFEHKEPASLPVECCRPEMEPLLPRLDVKQVLVDLQLGVGLGCVWLGFALGHSRQVRGVIEDETALETRAPPSALVVGRGGNRWKWGFIGPDNAVGGVQDANNARSIAAPIVYGLVMMSLPPAHLQTYAR